MSNNLAKITKTDSNEILKNLKNKHEKFYFLVAHSE
jgi:hypothetical protein